MYTYFVLSYNSSIDKTTQNIQKMKQNININYLIFIDWYLFYCDKMLSFLTIEYTYSILILDNLCTTILTWIYYKHVAFWVCFVIYFMWNSLSYFRGTKKPK